MMFCRECNKRLFKVNPHDKHIIGIKHSNREEYIFNLKEKGKKIRESFKPVKRDGKYLFDIINSHESILGIECRWCNRLHIVNLEKGTSHIVEEKYYHFEGKNN